MVAITPGSVLPAWGKMTGAAAGLGVAVEKGRIRRGAKPGGRGGEGDDAGRSDMNLPRVGVVLSTATARAVGPGGCLPRYYAFCLLIVRPGGEPGESA